MLPDPRRKGERKEMARPIGSGPLGKKILYCLRRKQPRDLDNLIRVYCTWKYGPVKIDSSGSIYQESKRLTQACVTNLALNGFVKVTADVPPFDGLKVLLTDKGRAASRRHKGERP